jgi:hypothetical protein
MDLFGGSSISDGSKKTYMSKLKKLNQNKVPTDLLFLKDTKKILAQIDAIPNPNTKRGAIIAVVSALKENKKFKKEFAAYHSQMMEQNTVLNKESFKSTATRAKQANVKMDEILARQKELAEVMPLIAKKRKITDEQLQQLHDLVVTSLYSLLPPRRNIDYSEMVVAVPTDDKTKNYYNKGQFFFNCYKTQGHYKQQLIDVPDELNEIIKTWIKFKPKNEYLLVKLTNTKYKPTEMSNLLKKVFKNDAVGVSVLRNNFLSFKYSDSMADLKKDTAQMGTSVGVALGTYIKPG